MAKKRKTRQQKMIARLKRQLAQTNAQKLKIEGKIAQKKTFKLEKQPEEKPIIKIKQKEVFFSYSPKLIKKDLIKTTILSLLFLIIIFLIPKFFHF